MTKKTDTDAEKEFAVQQPAVPLWIEQMHQYYQSNGCFRASDVQRVLGDPAASVRGSAPEGVFPGFTPAKRALVKG